MERLTQKVFDHIKAEVEAKAKQLGVDGFMIVADFGIGVSMFSLINRESALRVGVEGKKDTNFAGVAGCKFGATFAHRKDTGGETAFFGEVSYPGGHVSKDGEFSYNFSGANLLNIPAGEIDLQLMLVAEEAHASYEPLPVAALTPIRRKLPVERQAITHKFDISGHEGYITVGLYENGMPGELFLVMAKEGSTISGFADAFAVAISYALQYGVPLQVLVDKFSHMRFEPSGMTKNAQVRFAKSIVDYVFRWMGTKFLTAEAQYRAGINVPEVAMTSPVPELPIMQVEGPPCKMCGSIMVSSGTMWKCLNCGSVSE